METGFLTYKNSKVHYTRFGDGAQLLIALHGFADQGDLFCALEQSLSPYYTVYAIDLPFHGKTKWSTSHFDQKDLSGIIEIIRQKEAKERINFMGYSMGGRMVQKLLFEWIPVVDEVYLIAPDGLNTKWMFNVNMMPLPLRQLIHWLLRNPKWMIRLIKKSYQWKLISKFIHDFAFYHISTKEKRDRIFNTWYSLDHFRLNLYKVKKLLSDYPIPVAMFFGKRDEVIPSDSGKLISDGLDNVNIHLIDEGHLLIDQKLDQLLAAQLLERKKL